jgi:hypothetical protein
MLLIMYDTSRYEVDYSTGTIPVVVPPITGMSKVPPSLSRSELERAREGGRAAAR